MSDGCRTVRDAAVVVAPGRKRRRAQNMHCRNIASFPTPHTQNKRATPARGLRAGTSPIRALPFLLQPCIAHSKQATSPHPVPQTQRPRKTSRIRNMSTSSSIGALDAWSHDSAPTPEPRSPCTLCRSRRRKSRRGTSDAPSPAHPPADRTGTSAAGKAACSACGIAHATSTQDCTTITGPVHIFAARTQFYFQNSHRGTTQQTRGRAHRVESMILGSAPATFSSDRGSRVALAHAARSAHLHKMVAAQQGSHRRPSQPPRQAGPRK